MFDVVPKASGTVPFGVNDSGQIVDNYSDANGNVHGFISTPVPEPSSRAMFGVGVAVLAVWRLRKSPQAVCRWRSRA